MCLPEKRDRSNVSFDMKIQLAERFRMALPETLAKILKAVEVHSKNLIEKHGNKFIQIKFDSLDKVLYDKINGYNHI